MVRKKILQGEDLNIGASHESIRGWTQLVAYVQVETGSNID